MKDEKKTDKVETVKPKAFAGRKPKAIVEGRNGRIIVRY